MSDPIVTGLMYLPTGMDPDDDETHTFAVYVEWRGNNLYRVRTGASELSRAGKWYYSPEKFRRRQYRFTFEEAKSWAAAVVDAVRINGATWAEWQELRCVDREP